MHTLGENSPIGFPKKNTEPAATKNQEKYNVPYNNLLFSAGYEKDGA